MARAPGTPKAVSEGPMARIITLLPAVPVAMSPPIKALSPPRTRRRVEIFPKVPGVAVGVTVGEAVGVGVALGVAVGVWVGVAEGSGVVVALGVGVGVGMGGVGVAVGVAVAEAVAVGVGVGMGVGVGVVPTALIVKLVSFTRVA